MKIYELATNLKHLEEELKTAASMAEEALLRYSRDEISGEKVENLLETGYSIYQSSHTSLDLVSQKNHIKEEQYPSGSYARDQALKEWAELIDGNPDMFSTSMPTRPLQDAMNYFEGVTTAAKSQGLEPDYRLEFKGEKQDLSLENADIDIY